MDRIFYGELASRLQDLCPEADTGLMSFTQFRGTCGEEEQINV